MKHLILFLLVMISFTSCFEDGDDSAIVEPRSNQTKKRKAKTKRRVRPDSTLRDSTLVVEDITVKSDGTVVVKPAKETAKVENEKSLEYIPTEIQSNAHYYECEHKDLMQYLLEGALQKMLKRSNRPLQAYTEWELSLYNLQYTHPKISKRLEVIVQNELNYIINTIRLDLNAVVDEDPKKEYIYLKKSKK